MITTFSSTSGPIFFLPEIKETDKVLLLITEKFRNIELTKEQNNKDIKNNEKLTAFVTKCYTIFQTALLLLIVKSVSPFFGFGKKPYGNESNIIINVLNVGLHLLGICICLGAYSSLSDKKIIEIRNTNITNLNLIKSNSDQNQELELKLKDFRSLIVAMQGKCDDITALIGKKIFDLS